MIIIEEKHLTGITHHVHNFLSIMRDPEVRVAWYRCSAALRPASQTLHPGGGGDHTSQSRGVAVREGGSEGLKAESQDVRPEKITSGPTTSKKLCIKT